jgi:hypothetical protein
LNNDGLLESVFEAAEKHGTQSGIVNIEGGWQSLEFLRVGLRGAGLNEGVELRLAGLKESSIEVDIGQGTTELRVIVAKRMFLILCNGTSEGEGSSIKEWNHIEDFLLIRNVRVRAEGEDKVTLGKVIAKLWCLTSKNSRGIDLRIALGVVFSRGRRERLLLGILEVRNLLAQLVDSSKEFLGGGDSFLFFGRGIWKLALLVIGCFDNARSPGILGGTTGGHCSEGVDVVWLWKMLRGVGTVESRFEELSKCKVEQVTRAELGRSAKESRGTAQAWRYWVQDYYEVQEYKVES